MQIVHNLNASNAHRLSTKNLQLSHNSLEKLSSGLRINRAADDASGLAISEKMRNQLRGLKQASRNTMDGISLLQTAEGGLQEIHAILSRGRELAVQAANSTYSEEDKRKIQAEITQINKEIDNIAINTHFNQKHILNSATFDQTEIDKIVGGLQQGGWLSEAVNRVAAQYGLTAEGAPQLTIKFDQGAKGGTLAFVSGYDIGSGKLQGLELHIDLSDFIPITNDDGGTAPMYNDRIIAHEMTHAIMGTTMNYTALPKWFREGTAEFINGADERLDAEDGIRDGALSSIKMDEMINRIGDGTDTYWGQTSLDYSMGYTAVRYIHEKIKDAGGNGISDILNHLDVNETDDLDDALRLASSNVFSGLEDFVTMFKTDAKNLFIGGNDYKIDLSNADTGAIGGLDADGGPILTAENIIPENGSYTSWTADTSNSTFDVVGSFTEKWDFVVTTPPITLQVGANEGETVTIDLVDVTSSSLGVSGVDLVNSSTEGIGRFDEAINSVSEKRATFGALQNRLEYILNNNENYSENLQSSESRIRDVEMATEIMSLTKRKILAQASQAMLTQANQQPQMVLQLLK